MRNRLLLNWRLEKAALCLFLLSLLLASPYAGAGPPPVITVQPVDTVAVYGGPAIFTVTATSGTALSYQWYKDGLLILDELLTGQTSSSLTLNNVGDSDEGRYFVKVSNAGGTVTSSKASLTVVPNSPPAANNDIYSTVEDAPLLIPARGVLTNDTDVNSQALAAALMTNVSQGGLTLNANGSFIYAPPSNYFGEVSFTYRASDGYHVLLEQNTSGGDDRQIAAGSKAAQSFKHGSAGGSSYMISKVVLYLSRRSGGSGNLNFSVGTGVNSNAITGSAKSISTSSITNISDGSSFQIYAIVYDAPVGPFTAGTTYYLNLDNQASERFYVEYPNNNTYANGTYYEDGVNQGKDMRFQAYETVVSNPATVTINVLPVNDPPIANSDTYTTRESAPLTIPGVSQLSTGTAGEGFLANDTDVDGDILRAQLVGNVAHGLLSWNSDGSFTYTPDADYNGPDHFTYRASDGSATSDVATVTINVTPVSDPLRFTSQQMTANGFELRVSGPDSATYVISASTNLTDWTPIFTNYTASGSMTFTDPSVTDNLVRFYRAEAR